MRYTKIKKDANGRHLVFLLQLDNDGLGNRVETVVLMKDFKQQVRAENFQRKLETEITYDRNVRQEIETTIRLAK
tara:strand:- start:292 stop:516 length:225 start_codon:yes stop_codon:yes gene_type:complete